LMLLARQKFPDPSFPLSFFLPPSLFRCGSSIGDS
jgi:hypothetical protein